jgi:glycosyltransferase involved in cell wall biosynthesis
MTGPPLRVALDVSSAFAGTTGVARYAEALWSALAARDDLDLLPYSIGRRIDTRGRARNLRIPMRLTHRAWPAAGRPRVERLVGEVDVVHGLDWFVPPSRRPRVVTIHDAIPVTRPDLFPPSVQRDAQRALSAAQDADVTIASCHSTADELAAVAGIARSRIVIARPGRAALPLPSDCPIVEGPYILAVGGITPRKGYDVLAAAVARLGPSCPAVVVAGADWWGADDVRRQIADLDRHRRIELLGGVDDEALATLYRHASLVCHPSRAEGFGLPCLEAMAAGVAVVASDLPSIREMAEGDVCLVPPDDADALAAAIRALLDAPDERAALASRGIERARSFTWERTAADVVAAYRSLL